MSPARRADRTECKEMRGAVVSLIDPGSIAEELGWRPGDKIVSINGHELHDILDFRFYSSDQFPTVTVRRKEQTADFEIEKDFDEPLGVEFEDELFDGVRLCGAHCIFCFVDQLPKGLRKPLYLKDDDYRLSFLHGNFVTLANVTDEDLKRIVTQRLSPLYVSVHTTDPGLRKTMLGRDAPDILAQIDTLAEGRISLHTQIVLCRGTNDDEHLRRTIEELATRYPCVASIAIVPAGVSRHRRHPTPIIPIDAQYSRLILDIVRQHQYRFLAESHTRLVWAADEFYLSAGRRVPRATAYEGFPQIENGVGLVRMFLDSGYRAKRLLPKKLPEPLAVTVVTGELAAPLLQHWAESLRVENLQVNVVPVENRLLGSSVTVAGLIAGKDMIDQLKGRNLGDVVFVPWVALRDGAFLDDVTIAGVQRELGVRVVSVAPLPPRATRRPGDASWSAS